MSKMTTLPSKIELEADKKYSWCTCGLSQKLPFCDGAHKGTDFRSLKFMVNEACSVYLCNCQQTKNPPYCDNACGKLPKE